MKSQAKILFCLTQGFWGGAQKYVLDLATGMASEFEVHIALGADDAQMFTERLSETSVGITIHPLFHLRRDISPFHDLLAVREMKKLYKTLKPDIVHLNSSKAGIIGSLARIPDTKIVYTAHGWVFLEPLSKSRKWLYKALEKYTATKKDALITLSVQDTTIAQNILHIPKEKIHTIHLGIDTLSFRSKGDARRALTSQEPNLDTNKIWYGTVANHYKTKGLDILVEAISKLTPEEKHTLQFVLIGDGPEKNLLAQKIKDSDLSQTVFLLPFLENAPSLLPAFDVFTLPSRKEGLPYVLLEALQAGLPIIATEVGGIPSLITTQKNGWLVPPNDPKLLTQTLSRSLQEKNLWENISTQNKKESNLYSLSHMRENTRNFYQSFLHTTE